MQKILLLVFGIAFGLLAVAFTLKTAETSSDLRSRAANPEKILVAWEFNNGSKEGWQGVKTTFLSIVNKTLVAVTVPHIFNNTVEIKNTTIPKLDTGVKHLKMRMAVGITTKVTPPKFQGKLRIYIRATNKILDYPITGIADGQLGDYDIDLGQTLPLDLAEMHLIVSNTSKNEFQVTIDWMHIVQRLIPEEKITPTPTPTRQCPSAIGVNNNGTCLANYTTQVTYDCADGYSGALGDGKTCQLTQPLVTRATEICKSHSSCRPQ